MRSLEVGLSRDGVFDVIFSPSILLFSKVFVFEKGCLSVFFMVFHCFTFNLLVVFMFFKRVLECLSICTNHPTDSRDHQRVGAAKDQLGRLPTVAEGVVYETVCGRHVFDSYEARLAGFGAEVF